MKTAMSLILCLAAGASAFADEGGTGHYLPGSMASFGDGTPSSPMFVARLNEIYLRGSIHEELPMAGLGPLNVHAQSLVTGLTLAWRPDLDLAEGLSYAMSATVPYVWVEVQADLPAGGTNIRRTDEVTGLGDIVLLPLMVGYAAARDLQLDARVALYAPTGDYEVGRLANAGKNYWTVDPTLGLLYLGKENGIEVSAFAGLGINTENPDTDYHSGTAFHLDGTVAQHFPLLGGFAGVGLEGFWYTQVAGDSGDGAFLGDFKGRTVGLGPVLSFAAKVGGKDLVVEFKWLDELDTVHRLEGSYFWLKVALRF
jgi:hypothetical protein